MMGLDMNKNDIILIVFVLLITISLILFNKKEKGNEAIVYYKNDILLNINLSIDKIYEVNGDNGIVKIEVKTNINLLSKGNTIKVITREKNK